MPVIQTPGGLYERFFEEVGKLAEGEGRPFDLEDQPDMRKILEIAAERGIEIPLPIAHSSRKPGQET